MGTFKDIYLSYGQRESLNFAGRLHRQLKLAGYEVWFDKVNYSTEDDRAKWSETGIETSHTFLFIVSPGSLTSAVCLRELEYAGLLGKRIVPINHLPLDEIADDTLSSVQQQQLAAFYQAHDRSAPELATKQNIVHRIHDLLADMERIEARETLTETDLTEIAGWDQDYRSQWPAHEEVEYLEQHQLPQYGRAVEPMDLILSRIRAVIDEDTEYVQKHTALLVKALDWQRQGKKPGRLLKDTEYYQAESWFLNKPGLTQPRPPDILNEFICESKKLTLKGLCDVFMAYARPDEEMMYRFNRYLQNSGLSTWIDTQDVDQNIKFEQALEEGIQRSANVLFFLSPNSVKSPILKLIFELSLKYKKRIVEVMIENTPYETLPEDIRRVAFHELYDLDEPTFYKKLEIITKILQSDQDYYEQHRNFLVKALAWEKNQKNEDFLLSGAQVNAATQWIEAGADKPSDARPTDLHKLFIRESKKAVYNEQITGLDVFKDAFVSYNRGNSLEFVWDLYMRMTDEGFNIWFDKNDIPLGVDYQNQIDEGILKADNFIFVMSPGAIRSIYCLKEVLLAVQMGKRIIPLLHIMPHDEDWDKMRENVKNLKRDFKLYNHHLSDEAVNILSKLNWIYFQATDDFDKSIKGLIRLMRLHEDYVRTHTQLLNRGLDWQRHQYDPGMLLVGDERIKAEAWLTHEFEREQPPCKPSDVHADFICESKKNGQNMMTDIFICYDTDDKLIRDKTRFAIAKHGVTTWIHDMDIAKGTDYFIAIFEGIEKADNVLFLISPRSVVSEFCQKELTYAEQYGKRIIPVLIEDTDVSTFPKEIAKLQYVDYTDNAQTEDFEEDITDLLAEINKDKDYHYQHKAFLVQALKWDRNNQNDSFLLRGFNLKQAEAWLKVGEKRSQHQPLEIHRNFIEQSRQRGATLTTDVFVSYSRANSDFARKINEQLQIHGKTTWFDQESIASGSDFAAEINSGIENSDNFLFIITPRAILSEYCADEVEYAKSLGKRFVTVLYEDVNPEDLHPELAKVQWIDFRPKHTRFNTSFGDLINTLDTDLAHVRMHTRMQVRASDWTNKNQDKSLLLTGNELKEAELWLAEGAAKEPLPTAAQTRYIRASRREVRRKRIFAFQVIAFVAFVMFMAGFSFYQYLQAEEARQVAEEQRLIAEEQRQIAEEQAAEALRQKAISDSLRIIAEESEALALAQKLIAEEQRALAELLKIEAEKNKNLAIQNEVSLRLAKVYQSQAKDDGLMSLLESVVAGTRIQSADDIPQDLVNQTIESLQTTTRLAREYNRLTGLDHGARSAQFTPDGQHVVVADGDGGLNWWQASGEPIKSTKGHDGMVTRIAWNEDGTSLVSTGTDEAIKIWNSQGEEVAAIDEAHKGVIWDVKYSPDGQVISSSGVDNTIKLWAANGDLIRTLSGHMKGVTRTSFHPSENKMVSASWDGTIRLWDLASGVSTTIIDHPRDIFTDVAFHPNGKILATVNTVFIIQLWQVDVKSGREAALIATLAGHDGDINAVAWNEDGSLLVSGSDDMTLKVWRPDGSLVTTLAGHTAPVNQVGFHPDGQRIISAGQDGSSRLWDLGPMFDPPTDTSDMDELIARGCDWLNDFMKRDVLFPDGVCGKTPATRR